MTNWLGRGTVFCRTDSPSETFKGITSDGHLCFQCKHLFNLYIHNSKSSTRCRRSIIDFLSDYWNFNGLRCLLYSHTRSQSHHLISPAIARNCFPFQAMLRFRMQNFHFRIIEIAYLCNYSDDSNLYMILLLINIMLWISRTYIRNDGKSIQYPV